MTIHPDDADNLHTIQDIFLMEEKIQDATERAYQLGRIRGRIEGVDATLARQAENHAAMLA